MSSYTIALFVHIIGALGFFAALGLEWTGLRQMRQATTAQQVQEWLRVSTGARRAEIASMAMILAAGFYMMAVANIGAVWIMVAFWTLVLLVAVTVTLTVPRMAAIRRAMPREQGQLSPTLSSNIHHPLLWISVQTRVAMALGIVFLMTTKPELGGALLTVGIATALGLISAVPMLGKRQSQASPAM